MTQEPPANELSPTLTPEQNTALLRRVIEENISHSSAARQCLKHWNYRLGKEEFSTLLQKAVQLRQVTHLKNCAENANEMVQACAGNQKQIYEALVGLIGQIAFEKAMGTLDAENIKTLRELTLVLIAARREENQKAKNRFDREKWEFNTAKACADHQKEIQALLADDSLDEDARLLAIRRELFGTNLPD